MAHLLPSPKMQFFDDDGNPLSGGKVNAYEAGTSTRKATYTTAAETVPNANPVILNDRGEANIFWSTGAYKIVVTDSSDNIIYTVDNITLSATGAAGSSFRFGSGAPSDAVGQNGDTYLNVSNGAMYLRDAGVYSTSSSLSLPASAIVNTASGNLAAVTVQNALNELQGDINITENALNTGIISGGALTINGGDNTKLDIAAGVGLIVDHSVSPPTVTRVSWNAFSAVTLTDLATAESTDIAISSAGAVLQARSFTNTELRSRIFLGGVDHSNNTSINNTFSVQVPAFDVGLGLRDLARAIGDLDISGNVISSNGANLNIDKSAGTVFSFGRNTATSKTDPHTIALNAQSPVTFRYISNDGTGNPTVGAPTTSIDPSKYDDGSGTLQNTGANKWTIQRVLMFANTGNIFVQYGLNQFNKKSDAVASFNTASFVSLPGFRSAMVRCYIILKEGATDLSDSASAEFIEASKFGTIDSGSSSVGVKNSIEEDADELQLVGDAASPGNSYYYGTDSGGTKGFYALPSASGGGGGAAVVWEELGNSPGKVTINLQSVYSFMPSEAQELYADFKVPASYSAGTQIFLKANIYSADTSGTFLMQTVSTLLRNNTDAVSSTTNQRTSTNSAITASGANQNKIQAVNFDLTSASGEINAVAVAAGDTILVKITRGTDTATGNVAFLHKQCEVTT